MKTKVGKSNLDIIRSYLSGDRPFVQIGYLPKPEKQRKVGDEWTDESGVEWVQEKPFLKVSKKLSLIQEKSKRLCKKCNKDIWWAGNRYDDKTFNKTGMCYDCLIDRDSKVMLLGKWKEFQELTISRNMKSYVTEKKIQLQEALQQTDDWDGIVKFLNEDGSYENWDKIDKSEITDKISKDIQFAESEIIRLSELIEKLENEHNLKGID